MSSSIRNPFAILTLFASISAVLGGAIFNDGSFNGGSVGGVSSPRLTNVILYDNNAGSGDEIANYGATSTEAQSYTYRVGDLEYGTYTFRLRQEDLDGTTEIIGEVEAVVALAAPYVISEVYPNPSSGRVTVELAVREAQRVRVEVYDVLGRRVAVLFDERVAANDTRRVRLDGDRLSSGVYFVRVVGLPVRGTQTGEDFSETRRFVVAR